MTALPRIALALALALPATGHAEGARRVFACTGEDGTQTEITIAPSETDATGKGDIEVTRDGTAYAGIASSETGPYQFGTDTDTYTLIIDGTTDDGRLTAKIHHVSLTDDPDTPFQMTLTPFTCEITG